MEDGGQRPDTERKRDGFRGERMIVLPTEAFSDYVRHPLVRRLYLTDVGFFPSAAHHYRSGERGLRNIFFCTVLDGSGRFTVEDRTYTLRGEEAFCIPRNRSHCYYASERIPGVFLWVHFKGEDTVHFPLERAGLISFQSQHATGRMQYLFELLFRVLEGNYTLGNFNLYFSGTFPDPGGNLQSGEKGFRAGAEPPCDGGGPLYVPPPG